MNSDKEQLESWLQYNVEGRNKIDFIGSHIPLTTASTQLAIVFEFLDIASV